MKDANELQKQLFQQIREKLPAHLSLADELCELLGISSDSAYRRIRGEKPLTLAEVGILCTRYQLSLDRLLNQSTNSIVFQTGNRSQTEGIAGYLQGLVRELEGFNRFEQKKVTYCAKDIPLLHYFNFEELAAFKIFFWSKSILSDPQLEKERFSLEHIDRNTFQIGRRALELYNRVPTAEIWSDETINSTIRQIAFCQESGFFQSREEAAVLYRQLSGLSEHLRRQAETGTKFLHGASAGTVRFDLYSNDIILGHNTLLVNVGGQLRTYLFYDVLDFLATSDKAFCETTEQILANIMKKSSLISGINERERNKFFNNYEQKILSRSIGVPG